MNRMELIANIAEKNGMTKVKAAEVLTNLEDTIVEAVVSGEKVKFGLGTFDSVERKERAGRNPKTGEELIILASTAPRFKANPTFKAIVNGEE